MERIQVIYTYHRSEDRVDHVKAIHIQVTMARESERVDGTKSSRAEPSRAGITDVEVS